ncbi:MAG: hypothetical protein HYV46_10155 [candidate division NC10 bacterium]|nr:hypothetical protein [candidate division NC10 bacterium]
MVRQPSRRQFFWQVPVILGFMTARNDLVWGEGGTPVRRTPSGDLLEAVPKGELPSFAKSGSPKVAETYRYAAAHGETLKYIPCFCGCKNIGHRHNGDCYITERHPDGRITFNSHSAT